MALLLENNSYLVIDKNGCYIIYKNTHSRKKFKTNTRSYEVVMKYDELIRKMIEDQARRYYDTETYNKELEALEEERIRYLDAARNFDTTQTFPIMEKYLPEIVNSIPTILAQGHIGLSASSDEEMYKLIKEQKIFGEAKDC